jgi:hypothetical protein
MSNFTISKNEGYVNITKFNFDVTSLSSFNYTKYLWDFGDGVRSRESNPTHFYTNPSSYNITLNAYAGSSLTVYNKQIKVDLFLNNSIYFDYVPPPTFAGHLNRYPFRLNITSPDLDEHVVDLYAVFSRSYAPQDKNAKWTFLRPQWRFLDLNGNQISYIKTKDTIIKADDDGKLDANGLVAGVTGSAEFYFVDDIYNFDLVVSDKEHTTLIATLRTASTKSFDDVNNINPELPSDSNSLAQATVPYMILWRTPDHLRITENGIRDHTNPRWTNTKNPVVINSNFNELEYPDTIKDGNGVSVFDKNAYFCEYIPLEQSEVISISAGFYNLSSNIFPKPTQFKLYDDNDFKSAGYYKGNFIVNASAKNVSLSAAAYINIPSISGNYFNPLIWIPNPAAGNLNVIQYVKNDYTKQIYLNTQNILNQEKAIVHDINMPLVSSADFLVDPMALTGHHGINCVAALPLPSYHAWAVDSDTNQIYRISSQGNILCSINLKSLLNQSYVSPSYCVLDGQENLWVTLYDTPSTLKFDSQGNLLYSVSPLTNVYPSTALNSTFRYLFDSQYTPITADNGSMIEEFINPTCVDVDTKNNAWITYSNTFSSWVCKVSSNGINLSSIFFPVCSSPTEILCDNLDNVWIALSNQTYMGKCFLEKRNSLGRKLSTFGPFKGLSYLTIDNFQNPWFIHSYQYIGTIKNGSLSSFKIPLNGIYKNPPNWLDKTTYITEPSSKNFVLWGNGFENSYWNKHQISVIPNSETSPNGLEAAEYIFENGGLSGMYGLSSGRTDLTGVNVGSVYAKMDNRYFIELSLINNSTGKYSSAIFNLSTGAITGTSGTFGIYELENNWYRCYVSGNISSNNNRFLINLHNGVSSIYVGTSSIYEQTSGGVLSVSGGNSELLYQQSVSSTTLLPQPSTIIYGVYIWGAQWELGSTPSTYIPTSGTELERPDTKINVLGNIDESALKGIAFDGKNHMYVVNSLENELVVFDSAKHEIKDRFYINPKGFNFFPAQKDNITNRGAFLREIQSVGASTDIEYHPWLNSMIVTGDWTSWKWTNKFKKLYSNTKYLTGQSRNLDFYNQNPYEIYKNDENYDLAKQMKNLAFTPSLQESEFLFDNFLKNIFGNKKHEDLGVLVYEKISNFLDNHSDVDTCNINALYNLAASVDLDSDDFRLNYPFLIRRLMDLASINKTRLWGDKDKTTFSFGDATKTGVLNRGDLLNTLTYQVTGGIPVVLKTRSLVKYSLVLTGPIKQTVNNEIITKTTYTLNELSNFIGLPVDWNQYYEFYEYKPDTSNKQLEGVIDWSNPNTTLDYNASALNLWDGNEGVLETAFNYELYKGLNILNSN